MVLAVAMDQTQNLEVRFESCWVAPFTFFLYLLFLLSFSSFFPIDLDIPSCDDSEISLKRHEWVMRNENEHHS